MADLPITSDEGAQPVVINDPNTAANVAKVDSLGNLYVASAQIDGFKATYSASALGLVVATSPTDVFTIYGSASKTIKITRVEVSATENTSAVRDFVLKVRSAVNTGGTSSVAIATAHDSNNAAATATVLSYTANPSSLGTSVGNIRAVKVDIPATNLVGATDIVVWTFGDRPSQAIVLRGTSQGLVLNLNGVTSSNNSFDISIEWTEE
jgi:hypothetical protein